MLSALQDHTLRIWAVNTGKEVQVLKGHRAAVRSCKFSRDNAVIISGGFDRRAMAWVRTAGDTCLHSWERACIIGDYARGITTCAISSGVLRMCC